MAIKAVLILLFFISCTQKRKHSIDYIVSGSDTVIIYDAHIIDLSKVHGGGWGHYDTLTGIETMTLLKDCVTVKPSIIEPSFDTIYLDDKPLFRDTTKLIDSAISIDVRPTIYPISYSYTDTIQKPDSAKTYWKKKVLYEALFNQEMERINNLKNPKLTKKALRFQDSCVKYELLLEKLKK